MVRLNHIAQTLAEQLTLYQPGETDYAKDYYIDGRNTQPIFIFKMTTGGGKMAPQITR